MTDRNPLLELQGNQVLVIAGQEEFLYTVVNFVDIGHQELQLVNRANRRDEPILLTQEVVDLFQPIKHEQAQWKLVL